MPERWSGKTHLFFYVLMILSLAIISLGIHVKSERDRAVDLWERINREEEARAAREVFVKTNAEYIRCMATNIYHEAASEPFMGQVAVARVVVNRINHGFASNPCHVIYQKTKIRRGDDNSPRILCQFSWVCQNKGQPKRNSAYIQAEEIATKVLYEDGWSDVIPQNVLFFHSVAVKPGWGYEHAMTIGNHIFYKK